MKKLITTVIVLVAFFAIISIGKNTIAQMAVSGGVKAMTGLDLQMRHMNVGILKTLVGIKDLKLFNPREFQDRVMVDMPEIYVDYDLGAFLKGKVHLEEVKLNLKELTVVKNEKGELNLDSLRTVKETKEAKAAPEKKSQGKMPKLQIDVLELKVEKVVYKDYSRGTPPKVSEFDVNIDERYENITNPYVFGSLIVTRALFKTSVARLANFDVRALQGEVTDTLKKSTGMILKTASSTKQVGREAMGTAQEAAKETTGALKKIFSGGQ